MSYLISLEVRYLNWSAAGIWVISAGMASFLETALKIRKINYETNQIDILLQSPISNFEILMVITFYTVNFRLYWNLVIIVSKKVDQIFNHIN